MTTSEAVSLIPGLTASARVFLEEGYVALPWRHASGKIKPMPKLHQQIFGRTPERDRPAEVAKRASLVGTPRRCDDPGCADCETASAHGQVHIVRARPSSYGQVGTYLVDGQEYRARESDIQWAFPDDGELTMRHRAGVAVGARRSASVVRLRDHD